MGRNLRIISVFTAMVAMACFGAALAFPAVGTCSRYGEGPNWFENQNILLFGWLAIFAGQIGWFANIPFALNIRSLLQGYSPDSRFMASEAALVTIAIVSLQPRLGLRLPHHEGYDEAVCYLGAGFWLWVVAHGVALAATVAVRLSLGRNATNGS